MQLRLKQSEFWPAIDFKMDPRDYGRETLAFFFISADGLRTRMT